MARMHMVSPPGGGIYRLARGDADPFAPPSWDRAGEDGTFGNRFDDPGPDTGQPVAQRFRMIYCATQRAATFGETMARFRVSMRLLEQLATIDDDEPLDLSLQGAVDPDDPRHGLIPAEWRMRRRIGHTLLDPSLMFVDVSHADTMQHLREVLAPLAVRLGIPDIDLGSLSSPQRRFTQGVARYIHEQRDDAGYPRFAGIRYTSRLNLEWECWAVFDDRIRQLDGMPATATSFFADDADFQAVARLFGLTIEMFSGQNHYIRPWKP